MNKNLYQILEIKNNATIEIIRKSYKKLSLKYHPDKQIKNNELNNTENYTKKFIEIKDAYEILSDEKKRKKYDLELNINNYKIETFFNNLKNIFSNSEYKILIDIINSKIQNSLINCFKIDDFFYQLNEFNIFRIINNFSLLDIDINLDFTLYEIYNKKSKIINLNRITKLNFEEIIFPIDNIQIYEKEGEIIKIFDSDYCGNLIVKINISSTYYAGINYKILNNDLYAIIDKTFFISNNLIKINYLDDKIYEFDLINLNKIKTDFGNLYSVNNLGLCYFNTINNIININEQEILRGKLYILII